MRRRSNYYTRPADVPANAPVPKLGWLAQHALIMSQAIVLKAMWSLRPSELPNDQGAVLQNTSITRIAKATAKFTNPLSEAPGEPMPRRTVAHCLAALQKKGFSDRWETERARTSPAGTSWFIRRYDHVLQRWAGDSEIATESKRRFYVRGKGRHHMTPTEAVAWKLQVAIAEQDPAAFATAPAIALEQGALEQPAAAAKEPELPGPAELDFGPLTDALIDVCGAAAVDDARFVWKAVLHAAGKHQPPTVAEVCAMVHNIGRERRKIGGGQPTTPGFIEKKIAGRVEAWKRHRSKDAAERAKAERWQRDERVNTYAGYIRDLQRDDIPPDEREQKAELLSLADPTEVEAANRALEQTRSRTA